MGSRRTVFEGGKVAVPRKRKDREVISAEHPDADPIRSAKMDPVVPPEQIQAAGGGGGGGKLLAGYLAHEFLTRGTLLGRHWDPAAAARPPAAKERPALADRPQEEEEERRRTTPPETVEGRLPAMAEGYAEVAYLLKGDGAGIPGVVNPTQLVRWLRM